MKFAKIIAFSFSMMLLSACSQTVKTVQWEEEVPLNTGETIWVKRADTYKRESGYANPLKLVWGITNRAYEFSWQGQKYSYRRETKESIGAILLYASPSDKTISIVAGAASCVKPGYGEFQWRNGSWQLQPNVSQALIGQPRNLMDFYSGTDGEIPARVTQELIRNSHFDAPQNGGSMSHLLESKIAINCSRSK